LPDLSLYDFICVFGLRGEQSAKIARDYIDKPLVICGCRSALLICKVSISDREFGDSGSSSPLDEVVMGALVCQMIVDYLPPLDQLVAVRLTYNPALMSAHVDKIIGQ
jgi:hypothetical protein